MINSVKALLFTVVCILMWAFAFTAKNANAQLAEGKSKFLGNIYSNSQIQNFTTYWNQVTPENAGKWGSVEGVRDGMNWTTLDAAYNFAKNNGFPFRFHVLIWGNQQPGWIASLPANEQLEEIEEWFAAVAARYPNIDYLEVVNEPLHDPPDDPEDGGYINALGGSNDLYGTGWDWIIKAFELARQHFPDSTKLMINDYSIVNSNSSTTTYLEIINLLLDRDLIDGIGVQGHAFSTRGSTTTMTDNLDRLAETGLPIQICELDIDGPTDETQLTDYMRIFPTFWEHPAVEGITLWGWRRGLWRDAQGAYLIDDRGRPRPAFEWLISYVDSPFRPVLISPINSEADVPRNPVLTWHPSETATSYQVQVATTSTFSAIVLDTMATDTFLQVTSLAANQRHYWRASASNENGSGVFSNAEIFTTGADFTTGVRELAERPSGFALFENYPNPFNPTTTIKYSVPEKSRIALKVYNLLGQEIATIFEGTRQAGTYSATFKGEHLTSGVYLYKLEADNYVAVKRLVLLK